MDEPVWQPNYHDLSDDRSIRFGAECIVCQARYASAPQPLVVSFPANGDPDAATRKIIDDQKYEVFREFDAAIRSITIACYRCGRPACPDCWDEDKQMCGACVASRGLVRSPHRGEPVAGPLADGFLRRTEPGRYAEAGRPVWLKELLRAQADPAAGQLTTTGPSIPAIKVGPPAPSAPAGLPLTPPESTYPRVPSLPLDLQQFEAPTFKMPTPLSSPLPPPSFTEAAVGLEGQATSNVIECPRCGAPNYAFVTQCSECGLQMIQVCPSCERLNPGDADSCQYCGTKLEQPGGWTAVSGAIKPLDAREGRKRMDSRPIAPAPSAPQRRAPIFAEAPRAPLPSVPMVSAPLTPGQRAAVAQAVIEPRAMSYAPASTAEHPYQLTGAEMRPVAMPTPTDYQPSFGARLGAAFERLLTLALVLGILGLVGLIVAAEMSPQANHWITLHLHVDIKQHLDRFLTWLSVVFRQH